VGTIVAIYLLLVIRNGVSAMPENALSTFVERYILLTVRVTKWSELENS
jgi:hypothetical protein